MSPIVQVEGSAIVQSHDLVQHAKQADLTLVRLLCCGLDGLIRGREVHVNHLPRCLEEGLGIPKAVPTFTLLDQPTHPTGAMGELRLMPDLSTFATLPYATRRGRLYCDLLQTDGQLWPSCPRTFLQRMISLAAQHGLHVQAAFETEFYLRPRTWHKDIDQADAPYGSPRAYSTVAMEQADRIIIDLIEALESQDISIEQYHPEYGTGQHEISITHTTALRAADQQLALRDTVRGVARQHGLWASFAPSPFAGQAGNGAHLHLSLWDAACEHNLLYDPSDSLQLHTIAYSFIGGLLTHLSALTALTVPSVNSYRRLQPNLWSGAHHGFGLDNREAAVRIPSVFPSRPMASTNVEFRACDPSCNPYLALGGVLAAGLDGIINQYHPGSPMTTPPSHSRGTSQSPNNAQQLPRTLDDALDALEQDLVLTTAMGDALATDFIRVKRAEANAFRDCDADSERTQHRYVY